MTIPTPDVDLAAEARATADALLKRDWSDVTGVEAERVLAALRFLRGERDARASRGYNFTLECRQVLAEARAVALEYGHYHVATEQMLLALIRHDGGAVLVRLGIDPGSVEAHLAPYIKPAPRPWRSDGDVVYTSRAKRTLEITMMESAKFGHRHVRADHLVLGLILEEKGSAAHALATAGITYEGARTAVVEYVRRIGDAP